MLSHAPKRRETTTGETLYANEGEFRVSRDQMCTNVRTWGRGRENGTQDSFHRALLTLLPSLHSAVRGSGSIRVCLSLPAAEPPALPCPVPSKIGHPESPAPVLDPAMDKQNQPERNKHRNGDRYQGFSRHPQMSACHAPKFGGGWCWELGSGGEGLSSGARHTLGAQLHEDQDTELGHIHVGIVATVPEASLQSAASEPGAVPDVR